jgi:ABC-2 type transport system ATP-binding protein
MARRIGLAQALINDPDLLVLDEPTTGLDPIGTRQIKDLILELAKRGKTVLLCSHLLADVEDVCDRIAILYGGRIQAEGEVKKLLLQTDKKQIVTSGISDTALEGIKELVRRENADCEITSPMEKLETFFIKTVAEAREQAQPTSGAVSTTEIGDFLAAKPAKEDILKELTTAPVLPEVPQEPPATEKIEYTKAVENAAVPDEDLLAKLTRQSSPVETTPVSEGQKTETKLAVTETSQEQIGKDILDQLTGRRKPKTEESEKADSGSGDSGNA